ncbi:hypothetical protein HK097_006106, partial [Rhizophlyctis rosea]
RQEREIAQKCVVIVKATRMAMKKVLKVLDSPVGSVEAQDEVVRWAGKCSGHVDDLVGLLGEGGLQAESVNSAVTALTEGSVKGLLESGKKLAEAKEAAWFDTCLAQISKVAKEIANLPPSTT